ncbi:hypothetical protein AAA081_06200 [Aedoeadaptatus acetigenes]|uniref:Uncharacterized protein n=1 Tax=Aedoeadaptatus acetigenes TaxID=2981723 RepID=A0ABV1J7U3_9FIRM
MGMGIQEGLADSIHDRRKVMFFLDLSKKLFTDIISTPIQKASYEDMKAWEDRHQLNGQLDQEQVISNDLQDELVKACDKEGIQFAVAPIDEEKFRLYFHAKDTKQVDRVLKRTYKGLETKRELEGDRKPYKERYNAAKEIRDELRDKAANREDKLKQKDRGMDRN